MFLKSVKLVDFKSFKDITVIPVRRELTAIVGPNGCGKSNVVDAIRWVIGESSAKQLRGQSMTDVIFNGTSTQKPANRASVELLFDNATGRLGGEFAQYSEIQIRREVGRDGQSTYSLNGTTCRRRDILDIFLGTGLGPRSYSIIEQGMISQLIEARPDDLRAHFEEAAGISKYKERRRETENRLQHTQDNLNRLNDLRVELDKRLKHLTRQAQTAERYKVLKAEERTLQVEVKALQWQGFQTKLTDLEAQLSTQMAHREALMVELEAVNIALQETRHAAQADVEQHAELQKQYYTKESEMQRLTQEVKHREAKMADVTREIARLSQESIEHEAQLTQLRLQCSALRAERAALEEPVNARQAVEATSQAAVATQNAVYQEAARAWDGFQESLHGARRAVEVAQSEQQQCVREQDRQARLRETLTQQQAELDRSLSALPLAAQQERLSLCEQEHDTLRMALEALQAQVSALRKENEVHRTQWREAHRAWQLLEEEMTSLSALQKAALMASDKTVASFLQRVGLQDTTRLAKTLTVTPGFETAVESVLRQCFDAVCVDSFENWAEVVQSLESGHVALAVSTTPHVAMPAEAPGIPYRTLAHVVQSDYLPDFLQTIYVVDSLVEALALREKLAPGFSVITRDGVWIGPSWMRVIRDSDPKQGFLQREQRLKEIDMRRIEAMQIRDTHEAALKAGEVQVSELESQREETSRLYQARSRDLAREQSEYRSLETKAEHWRKRLAELAESLMAAEAEWARAAEQRLACEARIAEATQQLAVQSGLRETLQAERTEAQELLEAAREAARRERQVTDNLQADQRRLEAQGATVESTVLRDEARYHEAVRRLEAQRTWLAAEEEPVVALRQALSDVRDRLLQDQSVLNGVAQHVLERQQALRALETSQGQLQKTLDAEQGGLERLRLERENWLVRRTTVEEQLAELALTVAAVTETLVPDADLSTWETRLADVMRRIERLGAINLAAISEFDEAALRKHYLDAQYADLDESVRALQNAIATLDDETKVTFKAIYDKIDAGFQAIFPRIFGGGRAYLELLEADILTAGISVRAQPPGKKNSTIHMLSGGEKALTTIALIFSLFQLNPAPFCILDEVDAPLDDLNVGRFCQLVQEMSQETQFLMISHNKVSIASANHLMGVTMHEPGVSRIVSVDVQAALELVE